MVLSSLTTYYWACKKSTTTGATRCVVTAYPSGAPEFTGFSGVYVARSLVFCVLFCSSLFNPFFLFVCSLSNKWLMRKGPYCDYDKQNIYVTIFDMDIP
jgi:hypothetical protein